MRLMKLGYLSLLLPACLAVLAFAQATTWSVDPRHSTAGFSARHMGISNVKGSFSKISGQVMLDAKDVTRSSVDVSIDAASVDTGVAGRDEDLRGPGYFDVAKYPTITFKSRSVEKNGDKLKVNGDLTIHGVTRPATLDVEGPGDSITDPRGNAHRGFSASTRLNRHDFGVDGGKMMVGDMVQISIDVEIVMAPAKPAQ